MRCIGLPALFALLCLVGVRASARELFVDPASGEDSADGSAAAAKDGHGPLKTIKRALDLAQPGDTVHLAKATYSEPVGIYDKSGEPGKPITIDGHDAVIEGSAPLDPRDWTEVSPGLYKNATMFAKVLYSSEDHVACFCFVWDGALNRMGRSRKGGSAPWKAPAELNPGEWTYRKEDQHAFYIRIDPAKKLDDYRIRVPTMITGCQISGTVSHIVIANLTVTHVQNDGFALTTGNDPASKVRDIVYRNIRAIDVCDDGLSAHGDCEVAVDGFFSRGNATGICSGGNSVNNRVVIDRIQGMDLMFWEGTHKFTNSYIACDSEKPVLLQTTKGLLTLEMENCVLVRRVEGGYLRVYDNSRFVGRRVTVFGLSAALGANAGISLRDSIVAGGARCSLDLPKGAPWQAEHNVYDLGHIRLGQDSYGPSELAAYRKASGQDQSSKWMTLALDQLLDAAKRPADLEKGVGADVSLLPAARDSSGVGKAAPFVSTSIPAF